MRRSPLLRRLSTTLLGAAVLQSALLGTTAMAVPAPQPIVDVGVTAPTVAVDDTEYSTPFDYDADIDASIADWIATACFGGLRYPTPPTLPGLPAPILGERPSDEDIRRAVQEVEEWVVESDGSTSDYPSNGGMEIFDCSIYGSALATPPNPRRIAEIERAIKAMRDITAVGKRIAAALTRIGKFAGTWAYQKSFVALGKKLALFADFDARIKLGNLANRLNAAARAKGWSESKRLAVEHRVVSRFLRNNKRALAKSTVVALVLMGAGWSLKYAWDKVFPPESLKKAEDASNKAKEALEEIKKIQGEGPKELTKTTTRLNEAIAMLKEYAAAVEAAGDNDEKKQQVEKDFDERMRKYKTEIEFLSALRGAQQAQQEAAEELEAFEKAVEKMNKLMENKKDGDELTDAEIDALLKEIAGGIGGNEPTDEEIDKAIKDAEIPDGKDD